MAGLKLKKGDRVRVRAGKDRGKEGEIMRVLPKAGKVIVEGVNVAKKHQRTTRATMQGGIIDKDMPMPVSNVVDHLPHRCGPTRVGYRFETSTLADGATRSSRRSASARSAEVTLVVRSTTERPRLKQKYDGEIRAQLKESLGLGNIMEVPRFEKIVINMGVGRATQQASLLEDAVRDLTIIAGQKPLVTKARKSIAGFKLREGQTHRRQGHPARRPHVGVLRPAREHRHPPYP